MGSSPYLPPQDPNSPFQRNVTMTNQGTTGMVTDPTNPYEFATPGSAQSIGQQFGGAATQNQAGGFSGGPQQMLNFGGTDANAGLAANVIGQYGSAPGTYGNMLMSRDIALSRGQQPGANPWDLQGASAAEVNSAPWQQQQLRDLATARMNDPTFHGTYQDALAGEQNRAYVQNPAALANVQQSPAVTNAPSQYTNQNRASTFTQTAAPPPTTQNSPPPTQEMLNRPTTQATGTGSGTIPNAPPPPAAQPNPGNTTSFVRQTPGSQADSGSRFGGYGAPRGNAFGYYRNQAPGVVGQQAGYSRMPQFGGYGRPTMMGGGGNLAYQAAQENSRARSAAPRATPSTSTGATSTAGKTQTRQES